MPRRQSFLGKRRPHMTWIHRERPNETPKQRTERLELERGFNEMMHKAVSKTTLGRINEHQT